MTLVFPISILKGPLKFIIPKLLQQRAVDIAHEGHFGIGKTKALLREKIWFPGVDNLVEKTVKACQATTTLPKQREPLIMSEMPEKPWTRLSADFYGPIPSGEYLLVLVDEHSRYPIVEIV